MEAALVQGCTLTPAKSILLSNRCQNLTSLDDRIAELVLYMEEVQSLTEDLRLMSHFDPETLTGMQTAEALVQLLLDIARVEKPYRGAKGVLHSGFPKVVLALCSY